MPQFNRLVIFVSLAAVVAVAAGRPFAQATQGRGAAAAKPAASLRSDPLASRTLKNGLQVIVFEDHSVPIVTVELAVRNGSFTEPPELNGLSHLYEHMFFSPTAAPKRPADDADADQAGIVYNGSTREEIVEYYFTTTSANFAHVARMLADGARWPGFDEAALAREREVVIGEMDRRESNPYGLLDKSLGEKLFFKYPTRKDALGTRATVRSATTDLMRRIQHRYYVPNNSAFVVAGDVTAADAFATAERLFGDWERRAVDPFVEFPLVDHPPLPASTASILTAPIQTVIVEIGWQGPSIGKDDAGTYAADVFSFIIRQPNSRFQRALVDSGLTTAVDFGYYTQRNVGPIQASFETTPEKARAATKAVHEQVARFADPNYFTDEELASAKALLEAEDLYSREKPSEYVHTIAFWWSSTGLDYFRGYLANLRATTRADIATYLKRYVIGRPHAGIALMSDAAKQTSGLTAEDLIGGAK